MAILNDVNETAALRAQLAAMQAENAALKAAKGRITLKVSGKGAVSAYGMGQFPTTLYGEQWLRLLDEADAIRAFVKANDKLMAKKGVAPSPELAAHMAAHAKAQAAHAKAQAAKAA